MQIVLVVDAKAFQSQFEDRVMEILIRRLNLQDFCQLHQQMGKELTPSIGNVGKTSILADGELVVFERGKIFFEYSNLHHLDDDESHSHCQKSSRQQEILPSISGRLVARQTFIDVDVLRTKIDQIKMSGSSFCTRRASFPSRTLPKRALSQINSVFSSSHSNRRPL